MVMQIKHDRPTLLLFDNIVITINKELTKLEYFDRFHHNVIYEFTFKIILNLDFPVTKNTRTLFLSFAAKCLALLC